MASYTGLMNGQTVTWRQRVASLSLLLGFLLGFALLGPVSEVWAHDELTDTAPVDGAELAEAPAEIQLDFSADLAPVGSVVTVAGPLGDVSTGQPQIDGSTVRQPLQADIPPGDYAVTWRVTSGDGHPISGDFDFSIASAGIEAQDSPTDGDSATRTTSGPSGDLEVATASAPPDDRAANTAAAPAQGNDSGASGNALWVWGVLALALVTLGGLGLVAVRRR